VRYFPVLAERKGAVRQAGGLYVMGTNRHEFAYRQPLRVRPVAPDSGRRDSFIVRGRCFVVFGGVGWKIAEGAFRGW
jgi:hypothetical protein